MAQKRLGAFSTYGRRVDTQQSDLRRERVATGISFRQQRKRRTLARLAARGGKQCL